MSYLADTTVLIDHIRLAGRATDYLLGNYPAVSVVSIAELIQGAKDKRELRDIIKLKNSLKVVPITDRISRHALILIEKLFLSNHLEFLDALIAATAIENNLTLVTANVKHFSPIKGLKLTSWKNVTIN